MPTKTLLMLADISLSIGLIGHDEYDERISVALWLADENSSTDPRQANNEELQEQESKREILNNESEVILSGTHGRTLERPDWMEFIAFQKWFFTRSDPDPYPSTPHGHLHSANRAWPKLNPYSGRAFSAKHKEDSSLRLTKREMKELWRTEAFRDFCRSHILWYMEAHPYHKFHVRNALRFPHW